ncbi:MAG: hypothetical protein LC122_13425 [Chitinophagales bacterium]|nr:hypothetical protein [Chitinophagales bacterium]
MFANIKEILEMPDNKLEFNDLVSIIRHFQDEINDVNLKTMINFWLNPPGCKGVDSFNVQIKMSNGEDFVFHANNISNLTKVVKLKLQSIIDQKLALNKIYNIDGKQYKLTEIK